MEASGSVGKVNLPAGVRAGPGRETSQTNAQGQVVQGVAIPLTTKAGTTLSVFIPYSEVEDTAAIEALIARRVNAIMAITG